MVVKLIKFCTILCFVLKISVCQIIFPDSDLVRTTRRPALQCGKRKTDLPVVELNVIGGEEVGRGNYPWSALLGYRRKGSNNTNADLVFQCGGSLITSRFVLTAAHCQLPDWTMVVARLGEHAILGSDPSFFINGREFGAHPHLVQHRDHDIAEVIKHPEFRKTVNNFLYNDVALVLLRKAVTYSALVQPVCLPALQNVEGRKATVVGYGKTENRTQSDIPLSVKVKILDSAQCEEDFLNAFLVDEFDPLVNICAGGVIGTDTCNGDSGAGLVVEVAGVNQVVGVVSGGTLDCGIGVPGYYARVYKYLDWVYRYIV